MSETKALTALSGGKLEAVQFVASVISKASDKAAKAIAAKGHTIAFGLAYLMHHIGLTLADATDHLHQQAKDDGRKKENFKSFNHLLLRAKEMVGELAADDCLRWGKSGDAIGLAVPAASQWPSNKVARDVLTIAGLTATEALDEGKTFALLLDDANEVAEKRIVKNAISKGLDPEEINPDAKALAKAIGNVATDKRREEKDAEVVTAEKQATDDHIVQLIRNGIGDWSQDQIANMATAVEEAQAALNGVK